MGEEKNPIPSQKKSITEHAWFWPTVYTSIALLMVAIMFGYNMLTKEDSTTLVEQEEVPVTVETNARPETMKFPFKEEQLHAVKVLQDFYDMTASSDIRESALLVFNQTFSTSNGVSLSINSEPFEVVAAMSGEVKSIKLDAFVGNSITVLHANGMETRYSSVTDILVQEGDFVAQGEQIATTTANDWNPEAGIHLHFEVLQEGTAINPRTLLAF